MECIILASSHPVKNAGNTQDLTHRADVTLVVARLENRDDENAERGGSVMNGLHELLSNGIVRMRNKHRVLDNSVTASRDCRSLKQAGPNSRSKYGFVSNFL